MPLTPSKKFLPNPATPQAAQGTNSVAPNSAPPSAVAPSTVTPPNNIAGVTISDISGNNLGIQSLQLLNGTVALINPGQATWKPSIVGPTSVSWDTSNGVMTGSWSAPLPVADGGTGDSTLTAHGVLLGEGTGAIVATTPGTAAQMLLGQGAGADPAFKTMSGDATLSSAGVLTTAGISATITTAKLTPGGANGSMTFVRGLLTNSVPAT